MWTSRLAYSPGHLDAKLVIAWHDELVVECHEGHVKDVVDLLKETMVAGVDEVLNTGLDADHPDRVPVEVDVVMLGTRRETAVSGANKVGALGA